MESFKTALFCLADIARAMEEEFVPYMNILNYFFGLIKVLRRFNYYLES